MSAPGPVVLWAAVLVRPDEQPSESLMQRTAFVILFASSVALAQGADQKMGAQHAAMDPSKMGPWTRKPTNEKQTTKEVTEFFKQEEDVMKKGDFTAALTRIDFPVFMATDDSRGMPMAKEYSREEYSAM